MSFNIAPKKWSKGVKSHDLDGQLTAPEREIKCSPNSPLNKPLLRVLCGMRHHLVETTCHASQAFTFWTKKIGYHLMVALSIHSYVTIRSIFEEERFNAAAANCDSFWMHL